MSVAPSSAGRESAESHYSESFAEGPSFLSDLPSATSDDAHSEPDSLADATNDEVEARALTFLSQPPSESQHLSHLNPLSAASLSQQPAIDPFTLPRKAPATEHDKQEAHNDALAFLRRCLAAVDDTSWQFHTPAPFDPPTALGPRARQQETDGLPARDEGWAEEAFNLASYPTPAGAEMGERLVEPVVDEGEWDPEDGEATEAVVMEDSGRDFFDPGAGGFGDERAHGGGDRFAAPNGWGTRGSLARRVSDLAMN